MVHSSEATGDENGPLDQFKDVLEKMVEQISSSRRTDQVRSALTWRFTNSQIQVLGHGVFPLVCEYLRKKPAAIIEKQ
jgi:hypothetical protein